VRCGARDGRGLAFLDVEEAGLLVVGDHSPLGLQHLVGDEKQDRVRRATVAHLGIAQQRAVLVAELADVGAHPELEGIVLGR
jgi:hypothetical protein